MTRLEGFVPRRFNEVIVGAQTLIEFTKGADMTPDNARGGSLAAVSLESWYSLFANRE